jgi:hypothetical protein
VPALKTRESLIIKIDQNSFLLDIGVDAFHIIGYKRAKGFSCCPEDVPITSIAFVHTVPNLALVIRSDLVDPKNLAEIEAWDWVFLEPRGTWGRVVEYQVDPRDCHLHPHP